MLDFCNDCNPLVFGNLKKKHVRSHWQLYDGIHILDEVKSSDEFRTVFKTKQKKNNKKIVIIYAWP